ncbi:MAG TPA: hypothetical protein VFE38_16195, partial [Edaphobacter sp.]|nr:hypothetical protein [Edaphobacter sp.]
MVRKACQNVFRVSSCLVLLTSVAFGSTSGVSIHRLAPLGAALRSPAYFSQSSTSIFSPAGTPSHWIFTLSMFVLSITGLIFVIVAGLLTYALIRYRHRNLLTY